MDYLLRKVEQATWRLFRACCLQNGKTARVVLLELINQYIEKTTQLSTTQNFEIRRKETNE